MKKHEYEIIINSPSKKTYSYTYDYCKSRGKGIVINISNKGILIRARLSALYESGFIITSENHMFSDAIKKSLLLYLVLFSKNLVIKTIQVIIDGYPYRIDVPDGLRTPPIYSLVSDNLYTKIPMKWNQPAFVESLLSLTKSKYRDDRRWAALFAAICAKSKHYEVERFMYFWMAFNGIYGYFGMLVNAERGGGKPSESKQMQWLLQLFKLGNESIARVDSGAIAQKVISMLSATDLQSIRGIDSIPESLLTDISNVLLKYYDKNGKPNTNVTKYDITPQGYLLTFLPYYFRCNYFHAGRVLPLFCYPDEYELKCLHLVNVFLEEFIDNHLYLLFDDSYVNNEYIAIIKTIAINLKDENH